ncbi:hypothetical protein DFJ77DRAFT_303538 [Powellomyces hirtus]|nr:hypothetical protein DFJ77DRAFT_303538 [Powellomyces hirtus]
MIISSWWKASLLAAGLAGGVSAQVTCSTYDVPNGVCSGVISHPIVAPLPILVVEKILQDKGLLALKVLLAPYTECYSAFFTWACTSAYPKCDATPIGNVPKPPCKSTCEQAYDYCSDIFSKADLKDQLPNCAAPIPSSLTPYPTDPATCVGPNATSLTADPLSLIQCPSPLVKNPNPTGPLDPRQACAGACCISCPHIEAFYPPGKLSSYLDVTDAMRAISAILAIFILISFSVLHPKRSHPMVILWWFVVTVALFGLTVFFNLGRRNVTQCADPVTESYQGNNMTCAVQGTILVFAAQTSILWCTVLILNLHITTVWNSNYFSNKYVYIHSVVWGIAITLTALTVYFNGIAFQFGSLCFLSAERSSQMFFYPLLPFIVVGFLLHVTTMIYVARIAHRASGLTSVTASSLSNGAQSTSEAPRMESTRRRVMKIWKTSWRSMLLIAVFLVTFVFFWMFYFTQGHKGQNPNAPFIKKWIQCILSPGGSQEECSSIATPHLPPYVMLVLADLVPGLIGIWTFIIFGFRRTLFNEWRQFATKRREKSRSRSLDRRSTVGSPLKSRNNGTLPPNDAIGWEDDNEAHLSDSRQQWNAHETIKMDTPTRQNQSAQWNQQRPMQIEPPARNQSIVGSYATTWKDDDSEDANHGLSRSKSPLYQKPLVSSPPPIARMRSHSFSAHSHSILGTAASPPARNDSINTALYSYPPSQVQYDPGVAFRYPYVTQVGATSSYPSSSYYMDDDYDSLSRSGSLPRAPPQFVRPPPARRSRGPTQ